MKKTLLSFTIWLFALCLQAAPPVERNQFSTNTPVNSPTFNYRGGGLGVTGTLSGSIVRGTNSLVGTNVVLSGVATYDALTNNGKVVNLGIVTNSSTVMNLGTVTNQGVVINQVVVTNQSTVINKGVVTNETTVMNLGVVTNNSTVMNLGVVTNNGVVVNKGGVTNDSLVTMNAGANTTSGGNTNTGTGFFGNGGGLTNLNFDTFTNAWTANTAITIGQTNGILTSGAATLGVTGVLNGPTSTERYGVIHIIATGTITFTNPSALHASDFLTSRTLTNGNCLDFVTYVLPGIRTNSTVIQF